MATDMNDRRMVPGPSDEEIDGFARELADACSTSIPATEHERALARYVATACVHRWAAQAEYDAEKVEALIGLLQQRWAGKHVTREQLQSAVYNILDSGRSSSSPKGRVVEGWWAILDSDTGTINDLDPHEESARRRCNSRFERVAPCRIEILDAPEEG